ncbi:hypothetical protein K9L67_04480 [Candidatus Woesearchaeota archaeon]|nr:hypothetical protein [Candidatus Woesearchaeota archaeon]MCF7901456.1 hypothetical protein [Candidatus Woesearchaeota archaeon]MCF8013541.1 hypothetical protein [Candidatus Woesearchaeota archaeon]
MKAQSAKIGTFLVLFIVVLLFLGAYGYVWLVNGTANETGVSIGSEDAMKRASALDPLVFPVPVVISSNGETSFTIGFFNNDMKAVSNVNFKIENCDAFNPKLTYLSTQVKGKESHGFVSKLKISNYDKNTYVCTLKATYSELGKEKVAASKDIEIQIV